MDRNNRVSWYSTHSKRSLKRNTVIGIGLFFIFCGISHLASKMFTDSVECFMLGICWICVVSAFIFRKTFSLRCSKDSKIMITIGYVLRLILAFWGTYGTGAVINFLNNGDQLKFLSTAKLYYDGDFSRFYTNYPYILFWIFTVTGYNRVMPQLVNILCWYFGIVILEKVGNGIYGKKERILLYLYIFMPWSFLISTQLYREPLMNLLMMLAYYYLWKWMNLGRIKYIVAALVISVPSIILHSGNIALAVGICLIYIQWDFTAKCWRRFNWRDFILILGFFVAVPLYENVLSKYLSYLPSKLSLATITRTMPLVSGRTIYIPDIVVNNWGEFILWSIYLVIYYWLSPTPKFWSSPMDVAGFILDSVPMVFLWIQIFRNIWKPWRRSQAVAGIFILSLYTLIYAWGTGNAGTAMRHRGQLLGIMVMTVLIGKNSLKRY